MGGLVNLLKKRKNIGGADLGNDFKNILRKNNEKIKKNKNILSLQEI